jgi:hypothetical protein
MRLYDVRVLNLQGVWMTDTTTGSKHRAQERAKFLIPRVPAVKIEDLQGQVMRLEGL